MPVPYHVNAPLDAAHPRQYHYITEVCSADPDTIAERLNERAARGYRFRQAHFFGTNPPQATLIFERVLRKRQVAAPQPEVPQVDAAQRTPRRPDLDQGCPECGMGSLAGPTLSAQGTMYVRQNGLCPNCNGQWPLQNPAPVITASEG